MASGCLRRNLNSILRIASRTKEANRRRSSVFSRRYTGAKGIGRLAAHKLATLLEISSARWDGEVPSRSAHSTLLHAGQHGLKAVINWSEIEKRATLDEVASTEAIAVWPAPGSEEAELGVLMEPEVGHGDAEVYTRVQA